MPKVYKPTQPFNPKNLTPIEQYKDFYQTWLEFAAQKYEQVVKTQVASNSIATIYTVPINRIFYLCSVHLSVTGQNLASLDFARVRNSKLTAFYLDLLVNSNQNQTEKISYTMPILCPPNEIIVVVASTLADASAQITGFLVPFVK